jgi:hypothetical protein
MFLESINDTFQNCKENIRANFTPNDLLGCAALLQEREEGWPGVVRDLNRGNHRYHTCNGVANEVAKKNNSSDIVKVKQRDRKYALLLNENDLWKFFFDLVTFFYGELDPQ